MAGWRPQQTARSPRSLEAIRSEARLSGPSTRAPFHANGSTTWTHGSSERAMSPARVETACRPEGELSPHAVPGGSPRPGGAERPFHHGQISAPFQADVGDRSGVRPAVPVHLGGERHRDDVDHLRHGERTADVAGFPEAGEGYRASGARIDPDRDHDLIEYSEIPPEEEQQGWQSRLCFPSDANERPQHMHGRVCITP